MTTAQQAIILLGQLALVLLVIMAISVAIISYRLGHPTEPEGPASPGSAARGNSAHR